MKISKTISKYESQCQRQNSSSEIFKDIYGNRVEGFYVFGLA